MGWRIFLGKLWGKKFISLKLKLKSRITKQKSLHKLKKKTFSFYKKKQFNPLRSPSVTSACQPRWPLHQSPSCWPAPRVCNRWNVVLSSGVSTVCRRDHTCRVALCCGCSWSSAASLKRLFLSLLGKKYFPLVKPFLILVNLIHFKAKPYF